MINLEFLAFRIFNMIFMWFGNIFKNFHRLRPFSAEPFIFFLAHVIALNSFKFWKYSQIPLNREIFLGNSMLQSRILSQSLLDELVFNLTNKYAWQKKKYTTIDSTTICSFYQDYLIFHCWNLFLSYLTVFLIKRSHNLRKF